MNMTVLTYGGHEGIVRGLLEEGAGHVGLEWDRYLPLWEGGARRVKELYSPLNDFAQRVNAQSRQDRQRAWLDECRERLTRAASVIARRRGLTQISWEGVLVWRLASGLGADHPTENGFSFDRTSGHPALSGKSVKGLCRAAAVLYGWEVEEVERLFGPKDVGPGVAGQQGEALFFDVWPVSWPCVDVDITNNHHQEYYAATMGASGRDHKWDPVGTEEPNPVNFLTVGAGSRFLFVLLAPNEDRARLEELLRFALREIGIGAKTAVGYGRFMARDDDRASWALANALSPTGRPRRNGSAKSTEERASRSRCRL